MHDTETAYSNFQPPLLKQQMWNLNYRAYALSLYSVVEKIMLSLKGIADDISI